MSISQGEVWLVKFYPQVGSEISKLRPAVVVSHDTIGKHYPWMLQIKTDKDNGLSKTSAIDCFQVKNFSNERLVEKLGFIDAVLLQSMHQTIAKTLNPNYTLN